LKALLASVIPALRIVKCIGVFFRGPKFQFIYLFLSGSKKMWTVFCAMAVVGVGVKDEYAGSNEATKFEQPVAAVASDATSHLLDRGSRRTRQEPQELLYAASSSSKYTPSPGLVVMKAGIRTRLIALCGEGEHKCKMACRFADAWEPTGPLVERIAHDEHTALNGPDFLVIGTQKGGTTDVYERLAKKTQFEALEGVRVCTAGKKAGQTQCLPQKELHFFDWACLHQQSNTQGRFKTSKRHWCDARVYSEHFKNMRTDDADDAGERLRPKQIVGEATSNYLYHPEIPEMVHGLYPDVKIVILLRNPIDRAYSGFFQHYDKQGNVSFDDTLQLEMDVIKQCESLMPHEADVEHRFNHCIYPLFVLKALEQTLVAGGAWTTMRDFSQHHCTPGMVRWLAHVTRGMYYFQMLQWLKYYPPEQLLVLKSEAYFADPAKGIKDIAEFLGGSNVDAPAASVRVNLTVGDQKGTYHKVGDHNSKSKGAISEAAKRRLQVVYKPYNALLYTLLDRIGKGISPWED
jgi:hypothetical protein